MIISNYNNCIVCVLCTDVDEDGLVFNLPFLCYYISQNIIFCFKFQTGEKRKLPDSEVEKPVEKQRKLDKFMFSKR